MSGVIDERQAEGERTRFALIFRDAIVFVFPFRSSPLFPLMIPTRLFHFLPTT